MMFLYPPFPGVTKFSTISSESRVRAFCDNRTLSVTYVQLLVSKWLRMMKPVIDTFLDCQWFNHNKDLK